MRLGFWSSLNAEPLQLVIEKRRRTTGDETFSVHLRDWDNVARFSGTDGLWGGGGWWVAKEFITHVNAIDGFAASTLKAF
jgi:hypothetical protein